MFSHLERELRKGKWSLSHIDLPLTGLFCLHVFVIRSVLVMGFFTCKSLFVFVLFWPPSASHSEQVNKIAVPICPPLIMYDSSVNLSSKLPENINWSCMDGDTAFMHLEPNSILVWDYSGCFKGTSHLVGALKPIKFKPSDLHFRITNHWLHPLSCVPQAQINGILFH